MNGPTEAKVPPDLSDFKHLSDRGISLILLALAPVLFIQGVMAQDRLKTMPGYQRHEKIAPQIAGSVVLGTLKVNWTNDGNAFEYQREGKYYRYDVLSRTRTELHVLTNAASTGTQRSSDTDKRATRQSSDRPARGRQFNSVASPDGKVKAICHDRNVWLVQTNGTNEVAVTVEGSPTNRVKYGAAS